MDFRVGDSVNSVGSVHAVPFRFLCGSNSTLVPDARRREQWSQWSLGPDVHSFQLSGIRVPIDNNDNGGYDG